MTHTYGYFRIRSDEVETKQEFYEDLLLRQLQVDEVCSDIREYNQRWPQFEKLLNERLEPGDQLIVPEFRQIARSIQFFLKLERKLTLKKVGLHVIDLDVTSTQEADIRDKFQQYLTQLCYLEEKQRTIRQKRAIKRVQAQGKKLGRPKGTDPERVAQVKALRKEGKSVTNIVKQTKVPRTSVYRILQNLHQFEESLPLEEPPQSK